MSTPSWRLLPSRAAPQVSTKLTVPATGHRNTGGPGSFTAEPGVSVSRERPGLAARSAARLTWARPAILDAGSPALTTAVGAAPGAMYFTDAIGSNTMPRGDAGALAAAAAAGAGAAAPGTVRICPRYTTLRS